MNKVFFLLAVPLIALPLMSGSDSQTQKSDKQKIETVAHTTISSVTPWNSLVARAQSRFLERRLSVDFIAKDKMGRSIRATGPVLGVQGNRLLVEHGSGCVWLSENAPQSSNELQTSYATLETGAALRRREEVVAVCEGTLADLDSCLREAVRAAPDPMKSALDAQWMVSDVLISGEVSGHLSQTIKTATPGLQRIQERDGKILFQSATLYDLHAVEGFVRGGSLKVTLPRDVPSPTSLFHNRI